MQKKKDTYFGFEYVCRFTQSVYFIGIAEVVYATF